MKTGIPLRCLALIAPAITFAATTETFDGGGTNSTFSQFNAASAPGPVVVGGGPAGSFLRLTNDGVQSQHNGITFDATDGPDWANITATYDFRLTNITGSPADGFGFLLIPTATHGGTG